MIKRTPKQPNLMAEAPLIHMAIHIGDARTELFKRATQKPKRKRRGSAKP
ncbi:MAG TPA: hypothetical protein VJ063_12040 [Verrucomicrobiae bacterium]|nr:hypothetical protein [Verrucomicrobiae bacterium]